MKNSTYVSKVLIDILSLVDDLPDDCPDSLLIDGFNAIRSAALGCLRRNTEFIAENVKTF